MKVPYFDLGAQFEEEREELMPIVESVLASGMYVGGPLIDVFEEDVARFVGTKYCIAVNSGTDALILGLRCLGIGPGDEVITPPNSFIASTGAIVHIGAVPVFVDVGEDQNMDPHKIEALITARTKAIMPVHLNGRICDMDRITAIAKDHGIKIIEDAAQSMGSTYKGKKSGTFGEIGCFSCSPLKNFNCCGDGGLITTNDEEIADRARRLRNHGLIDRNTVAEFGYVSRMDALQAAILRYRLGRLPDVIERRRRNVALYREALTTERVFIPPDKEYEFNTYVFFVAQVDERDALQAYLAEQGVGSMIHYPIPIHLQQAAVKLGFKRGDFPIVESQAERILSLPHHQMLKDEQIAHTFELINEFYTKHN